MILLVLLATWYYYPQIKHRLNLLRHSKSLPYRSEKILGREEEIQELLELLEFGSADVRIVNIVSSPGFGKSTLAIHVGHRLVEEGIIVHYVNMAEIKDKQLQPSLAEKVLESASILSKDITFDRLVKWARDTYCKSLIILDNCDDSLYYQKEALQEAVDKIVESSTTVKVMMTSREITMHLQYFHQYKLYELSTKAACALLKHKVSKTTNITVQEVEYLSELAGNVPLALQIIGSILLLPDPPDPSKIIKELQEQPMITLSPKHLPISQQINASFSLSYKYLSPELRIEGQYLANFSGSFQTQAAIEIFKSLNFKWKVDVQKSMQTLVQRSLLVYNQRADRYNFHRLIREYFLEVQRHNTEYSREKFDLGFNHYYIKLLSTVAQMFDNNDHIKALRIVDIEKHNFQQVFENIKMLGSIDEMTIEVLAKATNVGLLKCRFSDSSVIELLNHLLENIRGSDILYRKSTKTDDLIYHYHLLIRQLAKLEEELHGIDNAIQVYQSHEHEFDMIFLSERLKLLEPMHEPNSKLLLKPYIQFFSDLAHYYSVSGEHKDGIIKCHVKIIDIQSKEHTSKISRCLFKQCQFYDIGVAYYSLGNHQEALYFLERAYEEEELEDLEDFGKMYAALLHMELQRHKLTYAHVHGEHSSYNGGELLDKLNKTTDIKLYQDCSSTMQIISQLRKLDLKEQAVELEEKLLQIIKDIGVSPLKAMSWEKAHEVALHLYDAGRYDKVAELGTFLLQSIKQDFTVHDVNKRDKLKIQVLIGKANFHAGNYSLGLDVMENVLNMIFKVDNTAIYQEEFDTVCKYLIFRVKYINRCYNLAQNFKDYGFQIAILLPYILLVPPLEIYPILNTEFKEHSISEQVSTYPELTYISSETGIATTTGPGTATQVVRQFASWLIIPKINPVRAIITKILIAIEIIFTSPATRVSINVLSVWGRLCILYYTFQMFCFKARRATLSHARVLHLLLSFGLTFSTAVVASASNEISIFNTSLLLLALTQLIFVLFQNTLCMQYWASMSLFLCKVFIFVGIKGAREFYRVMRDPRMIAECLSDEFLTINTKV